jgi:mannose-6-phosphate isomerase
MSFGHSIFKLKGVVQQYSWGGYDFIPNLLGIENKDHKPFAEYWMGAHSNHPSFIENNNTVALSDFITAHAEMVLGKNIHKKFSSLPYLLKVLDVRQMLSIQVHPSKQAAENSFEEENKKRIPVNAPHRNYKDQNHKPELMVALSDFWLLHGFKKEEELAKMLEAKIELQFLKDIFNSKGYKPLYEEVMLMPQEKLNQILDPLVRRVVPLYNKGLLSKDNEDFWAARAALNFCNDNNYDRGIFSVYFFNLVHLKKGEGIFQPSGLPHAYLEGQNVEIMANSDNVLRAGLTDKHIDVTELLKHVKFEATIPEILKSQSQHRIFSSPAEEFELQQYLLRKGEEAITTTLTGEVLLLLEGLAEVASENEEVKMEKGNALFINAGTDIQIKALSEIDLFRATVPRP